MRRFSLIAVLTLVALLVMAGFAIAAPTDSLENYNSGIQNTSPYYDSFRAAVDINGDVVLDGSGNPVAYDPDVHTLGYKDLADGASVALFNSYYMLNPRLLDDDAFKYKVEVSTGVYEEYPIVNANRSGEIAGYWGDYRRTLDGQNVHTDFQVNTNSCASCHMTHTAQGASLLFRANVFATCAACHDGSGIPFLNVFKPSAEIIAETASAGSLNGTWKYAGTFGVDPAMNGSVHLATEDVTIAAAPGGNRVGHLKDGVTTEAVGNWSSDFSCASCHSPHGSYSFRLLNWNVNNISKRTPAQGGFYYKTLNLVADAVYAGRYYAWYQYDANRIGKTAAGDLMKVADAPVYGFTPVAKKTIDKVDYAENFKLEVPWLYTSSKGKVDSLKIYDGVTDVTTKFDVNWGAGYVTLKSGETVSANLTADVQAVLEVKGERTVESGNVSGNIVDGLAYNFYCAACHTDYERKLTAGAGMGGSASDLTGIFSNAHRHTTYRAGTARMEVVDDSANMMCVSCHYVHGADALIQKTADEKVIGWVANNALPAGYTTAAEYIEANKDVNVSSAIKRHTNMAVCWQCHSGTKNDVFVNTKYYWDNENGFTDYSGWNNNTHELP